MRASSDFFLFTAIGRASYCLYLLHFNLWLLIHDSHVLDRLHLAQFDPWISYFLLVLGAIAGDGLRRAAVPAMDPGMDQSPRAFA